MHPILINIGPLTFHTYGLLVALGGIAAYFLARRQFRNKGLPVEMLDRLVLVLVVSGLVGARIFYFGFEGFSALREDPLAFFRIWSGGLVFYGGLIGGAIALAVIARRGEIPFLTLWDALVPSLLLAHAVGRLGCFSAGCCYGDPTTSWAGVTFSDPDALAPLGIALHPAQLYAAAANAVLLAGSLFLAPRLARAGGLVAYYLIAYGAVRFLLEFVRGDFRGGVFAGLHPSQWVSAVAVVCGLLLVAYVRRARS